MALMDKLKAIEPQVKGIERLFASMPAEEADLLRRLLTDPSVSVMSIYNALKSEGVAVARDTLTRYRNENLK